MRSVRSAWRPASRRRPRDIRPACFRFFRRFSSGAGRSQLGSITGFYTVLVEGDDFNEPIPDAVKGIVDGHVWLSRPLANRGPFSRRSTCFRASAACAATLFRPSSPARSSAFSPVRGLPGHRRSGQHRRYVPGANLEFDLAVQSRPQIVQFLQQDSASPLKMEQSVKQLADLHAWIDQLEKAIAAQAAKVPAGGSRRRDGEMS